MAGKTMTKLCGVCGDKAIGYYNFNAITCDSCKAFFRRNATKLDQFKCYFNGNCNIDLETRKLCKKCRLSKCFEIGMKKEWILTEEEKIWRSYKIQVNRKKKQSKEKFEEKNESKNCKQDCQTYADDLDFENLRLGTHNTSIDVIKVNDNEQKCWPLNYHDKLIISRPITDQNSNLSEAEGLKFNELLHSISSVQESNCVSYRIIIKDPVIEKACKAWAEKCQEETPKIVKMFKNLKSFVELCDNDQLAIIKYGSVEVYILRLLLRYNFRNRHFRLIDDQYNCLLLKMDLMREFRNNLFEAYDKFVTKFRPQWDFDSNIIHLLTPIILFNPNQPNLYDRDRVKAQQNIYMQLLERYLQLKYQSEYESKLKLMKLIDVLTDLRAVARVHKYNYAKKDPKVVSPLLKELFDLSLSYSDSKSYLFE